jgi:hypothetical protein
MRKLNVRDSKSILERKLTFEIIIEINHPNSWTIHENVKNSVDLFYVDGMLSQVRHFSLETIKLKCQKFQNYQVLLVSSVNESVVNYKIGLQ